MSGSIIRYGRGVGNTTRQINQEIDDLFTKGACYICDHAHREKDGVPINKAQSFHLSTLFKRLAIEFKLINSKHYTFDYKTKIITLK